MCDHYEQVQVPNDIVPKAQFNELELKMKMVKGQAKTLILDSSLAVFDLGSTFKIVNFVTASEFYICNIVDFFDSKIVV